MDMTKQLNSIQDRIDAIDALRGFALAGIVIVHMVEQFFAGPPPQTLIDTMMPGLGDQIIAGFIAVLLQGKFFALFSILFGLSFFIQMDGAANKGFNFTGRFIWRIILLGIIGYIHSLFYRGDILTIYAVVGLLLVLFHRMPEKGLVICAAILFLGLGRYIVFILNGDDPILMNAVPSGESQENLDYYQALKSGSIWEVFRWNGFYGLLTKLEFQFSIYNRGYLTLAYFLIGLWLGKIRIFQQLEEKKQAIRKALFWFLGSMFLAGGFTGFMFSRAGDLSKGFENWWGILGLTGADLVNVSLTGIIFCGFILLYLKPSPQRFLNRFTAYGRTALTNYLAQSVIGTFIFFGWGLGLIGEMRNIYSLLLAFFMIIFQMAISTWWLNNFRFGPLEWLWRSATYLKWQPITK